ncbi:hypothetical protein LSAT2_029032 [Lamellibrachia satsuma]|nr:hypothetical protein LSAT2_029032 [Lamellibrachia satsuma]
MGYARWCRLAEADARRAMHDGIGDGAIFKEHLVVLKEDSMAPRRSVIEGLSWRKLSTDARQDLQNNSWIRRARNWGKSRSLEAEDSPLTDRTNTPPESEMKPPKKTASAAAGKRGMRKVGTLTRMKSVMVKQKEAFGTLRQCPSISALIGNNNPMTRVLWGELKKWFNFSSPGQLDRDVDSVAAGIKTLTSMGDNLTTVIERKPRRASHIRTTPGGRTPNQTRAAKHIFV